MPRRLKNQGVRLPFHVVLTATDASYSKWQCRIMYYWYKKMKAMPESDMGGFTRILHSGSPDDLMEEILRLSLILFQKAWTGQGNVLGVLGKQRMSLYID